MDMSDGDLLASPEEGELDELGMDLGEILEAKKELPGPPQEGGNVA